MASGVPVKIFQNQGFLGHTGSINFIKTTKDSGSSGDYGYHLNSGSLISNIGPVQPFETAITLDISKAGTFLAETPIGILGFTGMSSFSTNEIVSFTIVFESDNVWHFPQNVYFEQGENYLTCGRNIVGFMSYDKGATWLASVAQRGHNIRNPDVQCVPNHFFGSCCYENADGTLECLDYSTKRECDFYFGNFSPLKSCKDTCGSGNGICCTNGKCLETTSVSECDTFGGVFYSGITCGTYPNNPDGDNWAEPITAGRFCYDPCSTSVSCCKDGKCLGLYSRIQCEQILGGIATDNSTCDSIDCCNFTTTTGACCICNTGSTTCLENKSKTACTDLGGIFMGENEKCNEISCECLCNGTSPQKYSCNASAGQCFASPDGVYLSFNECFQGCQINPPPQNTHACINGICTATPGGPLGEGCDNQCVPSPPPFCSCNSNGVCICVDNGQGPGPGCADCSDVPTTTWTCNGSGTCVEGQSTGGIVVTQSECTALCLVNPPPTDTGAGDGGGPNARPDGGGDGNGGPGPDTDAPCPNPPQSGGCCCVKFGWCDKKLNSSGIYVGKWNDVTRKICNSYGGSPSANLCGLATQMNCKNEDLSNLVRCCYRRRHTTFTCDIDNCSIDCDNPDIDWSICSSISDVEAEEYLRLKTNLCDNAMHRCGTKNNVDKLLYCCDSSGCPPFQCPTTICYTNQTNQETTSNTNTGGCVNAGVLPPPSPALEGFLIDYGTCRIINGAPQCDFITPILDPCLPQCIAFRDACRKHECDLAGMSSCPGVWIINSGCGCPIPGRGYRGCSDSEVDPKLTPASSFRVFRQIDKIENINALIEEVQTIDPVECSPMPSWYTPEAYPGIFPWCPEIEIEGYNPCYFYRPGYVMPELPDDGIDGAPTFKVPDLDPVSAGICPTYKSIRCDLCKLCTLDPENQRCIDGWQYSISGIYNPTYAEWLKGICNKCTKLYYHEGHWWIQGNDGGWWILGKYDRLPGDFGETNTGDYWIPYIPGLGIPSNKHSEEYYCRPTRENYPQHINDPILLFIPDEQWVDNPSDRKRTPKGFEGADAEDCEGILAIQTTDTIITPPVNRFKDSNIILVKVSLNNLDTCIPILCVDNCDAYELCE
jgi:hypothetical protein